MGHCVSREDFEWVYTDQPHADRRREILGEVRVRAPLCACAASRRPSVLSPRGTCTAVGTPGPLGAGSFRVPPLLGCPGEANEASCSAVLGLALAASGRAILGSGPAEEEGVPSCSIARLWPFLGEAQTSGWGQS